MENLKKPIVMLVKGLDELGRADELDMKSLELAGKLAHATKNLCKVIEDMDEYSGADSMSMRMSRRSYSDGSYEDRSYDDGRSMARGRMNAPRDSMGRYSGARGYSRHGEEKVIEVLDDLRGIVRDLPKDAQNEVERIIKKHEDVYA